MKKIFINKFVIQHSPQFLFDLDNVVYVRVNLRYLVSYVFQSIYALIQRSTHHSHLEVAHVVSNDSALLMLT